MPVRVFFNPTGFELDSIGNKRLSGEPADGDTPYIRIPIRMLSIDTPETSYPGVGAPSNADASLAQLGEWIQRGHAPVNARLAAHLHPRLATGIAGTLQGKQGQAAKDHFRELLDGRLTRTNRRKRNVFLYAADEHFDSFGRLLAYMAPHYSKSELPTVTADKRKTFNLLMIESGWAAPFIIYPSLPKQSDLVLAQKGGANARTKGLGAWSDRNMLTGYEWRMCIKLFNVTKKLVSGTRLSRSERYSWISRYCSSMETLEVVNPQDYHTINPEDRVFIWPRDVRRAVAELNLSAA